MFGMLDYRAHKLLFLTFFIPNFAMTIFSLFALPLINYSIGISLADERIFQILISVVSLFVLGLIWLMVFIIIVKSFEFIFSLFVDIIPHDGRTKDEAEMVAWGGDKAIRHLAISKHPNTWTDELINELPKNDWVQNICFRKLIIRRCELIKEHYKSLPEDTPYNDYHAEKILEENNLVVKWQEKVLSTKQIRKILISFSFFLLLIIFNPFV